MGGDLIPAAPQPKTKGHLLPRRSAFRYGGRSQTLLAYGATDSA